jgi:predicted nucleotidyltransferase
VLSGVTPEMAIWREEIFGAVVALRTAAGEADGIPQANDTDAGLVAYFYTRDGVHQTRVAEALEAGMACHRIARLYSRVVNPDETLAKLRERLVPVPQGVVAIYLFGSVARGTARASSDVDVGVLYEVTPPATLEGLGFDLAARLEPAIGRTVDLVVLNRAPADLIHRVLRDGILVVEIDRRRRIEFEVRARNEYFDLAPIRARYRRAQARS